MKLTIYKFVFIIRTEVYMQMESFWNNETGQDLVEYTLLLAFVVIAAAAIFIGTNCDTPQSPASAK